MTRSALDATRRRAESEAQGRRHGGTSSYGRPSGLMAIAVVRTGIITRVGVCALCGRPAADIDCGWAPCPRYCRTCTRGMRRTRMKPEGFPVDVLRCLTCGQTTVAHEGLRVPCEVCRPLHWMRLGGGVFEDEPGSATHVARLNQWFGECGFEYVGRRVHVKPKKAPPSRAWVRHRACGRVMPKVTPYPQGPRCPWCEGLPDRSMAALGHLPGHLYLLRWENGRAAFLKAGIGLAQGNRVSNQVREGAHVVEVRQASLLECRRAEHRLLSELKAWRTRPEVPLRLGGDTECLKISAPIGSLRHWFESGVRSRDVTRLYR